METYSKMERKRGLAEAIWFWITGISGMGLISAIALRLWAYHTRSTIIAYDLSHNITKVVIPGYVTAILSQNFWFIFPVLTITVIAGGLTYAKYL